MDPCFKCMGACCEYVMIDISKAPPDLSWWWSLHGTNAHYKGRDFIELDARCRLLDKFGKCTSYDFRPDLCEKFEVGGDLCRMAIKRQRGEGAIERILGDEK